MIRNWFLFLTVLLSTLGFAQPTDNPYKTKYGTAPIWTNEIRWEKTINILDFALPNQTSWDEALILAKSSITQSGGGVIYFPAGTYIFANSVSLVSGVVLRGDLPENNNAKVDSFAPPTRFVFPKYEPILSGNGTPNSTAFKVISGSGIINSGLVHLDINRGRVSIGSSGAVYSRNIIVFGIRLNNVAEPQGDIPSSFSYMERWQRFSYAMTRTISVNVSENASIINSRFHDLLNNRYNPIFDDSYDQPGYVAKKRFKGPRDRPTGVATSETINDIVVDTTHIQNGEWAKFDYLAHYVIGISGKLVDPSTLTERPNQHIEVIDNWMYHTMRVGIFAKGIGVVIRGNIKRDSPTKRVFIHNIGSILQSNNAATYENRGINFAGENIVIENNDMRIYHHAILYTGFSSVDGEGILIQTQDKIGKWMDGIYIRNNKVNAYIGFWDCQFDQRNLYITGNNLMNSGNILIYKGETTYRVDNVYIENNDSITGVGVGSVAVGAANKTTGNNIFIRNNKGTGSLKYPCQAVVENNIGFTNTPNPCVDYFNGSLAVTPSYGQQGVAKNTEISVVYPSALTEVNLSGISLTGQTAGNIHVTTGIIGQKLIITAQQPLLPNEKYTVNIPSNSFKSTSTGDTCKVLNWWFVTQARPYFYTVYPTNNAWNVNTDLPIQIQWSEPVVVKEINKIKILNSENVAVEGISLDWNASLNLLTIIHKPLLPNQNYHVSIESGAVENNDLNRNEAISWNFNTIAAAPSTVIKEREFFDSGFSVFPNPATRLLNVQIPSTELITTVQIFSVTGLLLRTINSQPQHTLVSVDISWLKKGVYLVRISNKSDAETLKIIKE